MSPHLILNHPEGAKLALRIPPPDGLVNLPAPDRALYVLVFVAPSRAEAIYTGMGLGGSDKVTHRLQDMMGDANGAQPRCEVPFVGSRSGRTFEVRNDAYVLGALLVAGVERVPLVAHVDDVGALIAPQP